MKVLLMGAAVAFCCMPAAACYSGLVIVPTADTVGDGQWSVELQHDGLVSAMVVETSVLNTQFGIGPGLEIGADIGLDADTQGASRVMLNGKYAFDAGEAGRLAVGICNTCRACRSVPYFVATIGQGAARAHVGALRSEGANHWFVGVDRSVSNRLALLADYTEGSDQAASVGANYQINKRLSVMAGVLLPNDGSGAAFTVHVVLSGGWR